MPFSNPNVIPDNQFQYSRQQVTVDIRRESVRAGFERQVSWEQDTKKFYEQIYTSLAKAGENAAAAFLLDFIKDVDYELASAQQMLLELEADEYNMNDIITSQGDLKKQYKKRLKEIALCLI